MKPVFTFDEIRTAESRIIQEQSVPSILLMENAGRNSFDIIKQIDGFSDYEIYIICGKGNNAGDGFVIARFFLIGYIDINLVCIYDESNLKGDALINARILNQCSSSNLKYLQFEDFKNLVSKSKKNLIIDAIQGTGIRGLLDNKTADAINFINDFRYATKKTVVVSVDVPSGLMGGDNVNPIVKADYTITMGDLKYELLFDEGKENAGDIKIANIGITENTFENHNSYGKYFVEKNDIRKIFPKRKKTSYKYSNGKLLIIGGSKGLSGAVIMSSLSALRSGCGAVVAAIPECISNVFNRKLYEVMTLELEDTEYGTIMSGQLDKLRKRIEWADVVLIGPGISTNTSTKEFVFDVLNNCEKNLVIDADALNILSENSEILKKRKFGNRIILTPHIGEFSRLTKLNISEIKKYRIEIVRLFTKEFKVNLVLKDATSISVTEEGNAFINSTGNEALATAGSGDLLSGIIASVFSQTKDEKTAMLVGNFIHGYCTDIYAKVFKNKQTATVQDFIKLIPKVITELLTDDR